MTSLTQSLHIRTGQMFLVRLVWFSHTLPANIEQRHCVMLCRLSSNHVNTLWTVFEDCKSLNSVPASYWAERVCCHRWPCMPHDALISGGVLRSSMLETYAVCLLSVRKPSVVVAFHPPIFSCHALIKVVPAFERVLQCLPVSSLKSMFPSPHPAKIFAWRNPRVP